MRGRNAAITETARRGWMPRAGRMLAAAGLSTLLTTQVVSAVELVSSSVHNRAGNAASNSVATNAFGDVVVFYSDANDLVPGDTNGVRDVFVHDQQIGHVERISVSSDGVQGDRGSHTVGDAAAISGDGNVVAFYSNASNLVAGDDNGTADVFVRSRQAATTELVSVSTDGVLGNGASLSPSISADGNIVVFQSLASNLVADDTNNAADIFVRDVAAGTTERLCGVQGNRFSFAPSVSPDGNFVAFASAASNLVPNDTNNSVDIFVCDRSASTIERVSVGVDGLEANADSIVPFISSYGCSVAFKSEASNLVDSDYNEVVDVFVHDRVTDTTTLISASLMGSSANDSSFPPSMSYDGRFVAFGSFATNMVFNDNNSVSSVFVRSRYTNEIVLVDVNDDGVQADGGTADIATGMTGTGDHIGFVSIADNLVSNDLNELLDVFVAPNPIVASLATAGEEVLCVTGSSLCCRCGQGVCAAPVMGVCPPECTPVCNATCRDDGAGGRCVSCEATKIMGQVRHDADADGDFTDPDEALAGVLVELFTDPNADGDPSDGTLVENEITNDQGEYLFDNVDPGDYVVVETDPQNFRSTADIDGGNFNWTAVEVQGGTMSEGNDFLDTQLANISGRVLNDTDADGNPSDGDAGLPHVTIELFTDPNVDGDPSDGVLIDSTVTNDGGQYTFFDIEPGNYVVVETDPQDFRSVADATGANDNRITVNMPGGTHSEDNDFYDTQLANIRGQVRNDADGDGDPSEPEAGVEGVMVQLLNADGEVIATVKTDANGEFIFTDVPPGDYVVMTIDPPGFRATADSDGGDPNQVAVNMPGGQDATGIYFLSQELLQIVGQVRNDVDADGDLGDADDGVAGVSVEVFSGSGALVASTTSEADGSYRFSNLDPGMYIVVETDPQGFRSTADADGGDFNRITVDRTVGGVLDGQVFLDTQLADIRGQVRNDTDGDGDPSDDDAGIAGVLVELFSDPNGDGDHSDGSLIASVTTNGMGEYVLSNIPPGGYVIVATDADGFRSTYDRTGAPEDSSISVLLPGGVHSEGNDFLDTQTAAISGQVRNDTDGDGDLSDEDAGIAGVTIQLFTDSDTDGDPSGETVVGTAVTDADGFYELQGIAPGAYIIVEIDPAHFRSTNDIDGGADSRILVLLPGGVHSKDNDFLDTQLTAIRGQVRDDTDEDGDLNDDDAGIAEVEIALYRDGEQIAMTTTDADGYYAFEDVAPGSYVVRETDPKDFVSTADSEGENDNEINIDLMGGVADTDNDFLDTIPKRFDDDGCSITSTSQQSGSTGLLWLSLPLAAVWLRRRAL